MGIGLSTEEFGNNMSKLPGWDKHSYGYHGDNGHTFNSAGNGQPYGPTFTTGDVVGCGVNLVDNTCFYTKNGVHLGIAFTDLPSNLYPTVGLQTPGEIVDTNFGQSPFVFNIEDLMQQEMRMKTKTTIENYPVPDDQGEWQSVLHRIVSTYLVHHGYSQTAESFARSTRQTIAEEVMSIKNRQKLQRLVLAGCMGEAIATTQRLYPNLLQQNPNLEFMLKCRQFVEIVSGTESEIRPPRSEPRSSRSSRSSSRHASPAMSPHRDSAAPSSSSPHLSISSPLATDPLQMHHSGIPGGSTSSSSSSSGGRHGSSLLNTSKPISPKSPKNLQQQHQQQQHQQQQQQQQQDGLTTNTAMTSTMNALNLTTNGSVMNGSSRIINPESDIDMDVDCHETNGVHTNGNSSNGHAVTNGKALSSSSVNGVCPPTEDMETDELEGTSLPPVRQLCGGSHSAIEHMLKFGRELQCFYDKITRENGKNETNANALREAFSLLAYADPWNSEKGYQLDPLLREPVCAALNSAILESQNMPKHPPLELALCHVTETMKLMSKYGAGSCAFSGVDHYLN
nr:ran-binding protein 10-like isoform X1 [Lytechinus pictus]